MARELVKQHRLQYAIWVPIGFGVAAGTVAGLLAPSGLEDNSTYDHWNPLFATAAQVLAALLLALIVEARSPFSETGQLAVRIAAVSAGLMLGAGEIAALVGLSPSLSCSVYTGVFVLTLGGFAGGLTAVVMLGISVALATLRGVEEITLRRLADMGDLSAREILRRRDAYAPRPPAIEDPG